MKAEFYSVMIVVELSLLFVPVIAPFVASKIFDMPSDVKNKVYFWSISLLLISIVIIRFGISFTSLLVNSIAIALIYSCYGFLARSLFLLKPKFIGSTLGLIASSPLIIGSLLSTFGILVSMWIIDDFIADFETKTQTDLKCLVFHTGNATAAGGTTFGLYKSLFWQVEYRVAEKYFSSDEALLNYQVECQKLAESFN